MTAPHEYRIRITQPGEERMIQAENVLDVSAKIKTGDFIIQRTSCRDDDDSCVFSHLFGLFQQLKAIMIR